MRELVDQLEGHLNTLVYNGPIEVRETPKYYKMYTKTSIYCFIAKEEIDNKSIGYAAKGSIMMPAGCNVPAKHARGNVYDKETWKCCEKYSVAYIRR